MIQSCQALQELPDSFKECISQGIGIQMPEDTPESVVRRDLAFFNQSQGNKLVLLDPHIGAA